MNWDLEEDRREKEKNIYRMSQEKCARLREGVPFVKVYRYNRSTLDIGVLGYIL
jgi:hypothetical protein